MILQLKLWRSNVDAVEMEAKQLVQRTISVCRRQKGLMSDDHNNYWSWWSIRWCWETWRWRWFQPVKIEHHHQSSPQAVAVASSWQADDWSLMMSSRTSAHAVSSKFQILLADKGVLATSLKTCSFGRKKNWSKDSQKTENKKKKKNWIACWFELQIA